MLDLPEPDRALLGSDPLDLVVAQVRFNERPAISTPDSGIALHEALGGEGGVYDRMEQAEGGTINIVVGPGGRPQVETAMAPSGWRLASADGVWSATFMPDAVTVETRKYPGWTDFRARIADALEAVHVRFAPQIEARVGLRYVDRLTRPDALAPQHWAAHLRPALSGFLAHDKLAPVVTSQQHQVTFDLGAGGVGRLVHGTLVTDTRTAQYVLDADLYRETGRPFAMDAILDAFDGFNTDALKLFQASVTPEQLEVLR